MLDAPRSFPALRGILHDTARTGLFLSELRSVLLSCGRTLISDGFLSYATFAVKEREALPRVGQVFYESGIAAFHELIRIFLNEAQAEGILALEDAEAVAWIILSLVCGCAVMRGIVTGEIISEAEMVANVDNAVNVFASGLSRG